MLQGVPAFIMRVLLAALFCPPRLDNAAFALRPLCVARDLGWCEYDYPRWDAHIMPICTCNTPVLGAPASIMGSELSVYLAPASLCFLMGFQSTSKA
jgi:hypothetical protein